MINNTRIFYSSIVTERERERERERDFIRCVWLWSLPRSHLKYILIHSASKMSRSLPWTSFHKRGGKASSCEQIEWRGEFVKSTSVLTLQCGNSATIWTDESEKEITLLEPWRFTIKGCLAFSNQNSFSSPSQNIVTFPPVTELISSRYLRFFARSGRKLGVWRVKKACVKV